MPVDTVVDVDAAERESWTAKEARLPEISRLESLERQLEFVDRIVGLEAELSEVSAATRVIPSEQLAIEHRLIEMQSSLAWRLGNAMTAPCRTARRLLRR
jgi:hypothetical protein